jgi:hypothetical protein
VHRNALWAVTFLTFPITTALILFAWAGVDTALGYREVANYVEDHQQLVQDRLRDPRVHAFSLSHDPEHSGAMLITVDVDDKATFDAIEADLDDIWGMRKPPQWDINVRSKEELGDNLGYAAWGIGLIAMAQMRLLTSIVLSIALPPFLWFLGLGCWQVYRRM